MYHDETIMPFGKYKGKKLREIPDDYWLWFRKQSWCLEYGEHLLRYADCVDPVISTRNYKTGIIHDGKFDNQ